MTRWKASIIHFCISLLVVSAVLLGVTWFWFPVALWRMAELTSVVKILALVDVTLGPALTLVVFKRGKPGLRFDLAVIALLQVAGLVYGLSIMFDTRPVYYVAGPERLEIAYASEFKAEEVALGAPGFNTLGWLAPKQAGVRMPKEKAAIRTLIDENMQGNLLERMPKYFVPIGEVADLLLERAKPINEEPTSPNEKIILQAVLARGLAPNDVVYHPLDSARGSAGMLLDAKTAAIIAPIDVDPYAEDQQ